MVELDFPSTFNKAEFRRSLLKMRQSLDREIWQEKSLHLCQQLTQSPLFATAQTILTYLSVRQEPDLKSLLNLQKDWGVPRCVGKNLVWHRYLPDAFPLQPGAFGILEPHPESPLIDVEQVDLILVPAVACDRQGYRLGYGGGYYDRVFSSPLWADKPTIGIVFDFAYLPQLPRDVWDQPLQAICTEVGLFPATREGSDSVV